MKFRLQNSPRYTSTAAAVLLAWALVGSGIGVLSLVARPSLPSVFGDHMVLQSGMAAPIWGTANPGESVTVTFANQSKTALASTDGKWRVALDPLTPSAEPRELIVRGESELRLNDVLVGEVWLCSGQSNMEKPIGEQRGQKPVLNAEEEIRAANFPQIRLLKIKKTRADSPAADLVLTAPWTVCSPETIDAIKFSAAGYFFGRKLNTELNVPIGLIDSSWGGTRIEPWTPAEGFDTVPALAPFALAARQPGAKTEGTQPSSLCNAMIFPLAPFALRGAIWYQGETNLIDEPTNTAGYTDKMAALINGWRQLWKSELSFYYVQLAPHLYHVVRPASTVSPEIEPLFWEAQTAALRIPRTGMIVTTDLVDDLMDIHPRNKRDVGERLARWALAKDYARSDIVFSGPVFRSMEIKGNLAYLDFEHVDGGLVSQDEKPLRWFIVAGEDGVFFPAQAVAQGGRIIVSSPRVAAPKTVRFAWDEGARPNLANKAGLPAMPFRTDNPLAKTESPKSAKTSRLP